MNRSLNENQVESRKVEVSEVQFVVENKTGAEKVHEIKDKKEDEETQQMENNYKTIANDDPANEDDDVIHGIMV